MKMMLSLASNQVVMAVIIWFNHHSLPLIAQDFAKLAFD